MDHILVSGLAFPDTSPKIGDGFKIGGQPYQVSGYAGRLVDKNKFANFTAVPVKRHLSILKVLPDISPSFVLPLLDMKDLDRVFSSKSEAVRYWLYLGEYALKVVKYFQDDFYRIPFQSTGDIVDVFDFDCFRCEMGLSAEEIAELLMSKEPQQH